MPVLHINYEVVDVNYWFLVAALVSILYFFDSAVSSHTNRLISKNIKDLHALTLENKAYLTSLAILLCIFVCIGLLPVLIISGIAIFNVTKEFAIAELFVFILAALLCTCNFFTGILHAAAKIHTQKKNDTIATTFQLLLTIIGIFLQWDIEIVFFLTIASQILHHILNIIYIHKHIINIFELAYFDKITFISFVNLNAKKFIATFFGIALGYGLYHMFALGLVFFLSGQELLSFQFTLRILLFSSQFLQVLVHNKLPSIIDIFIEGGFKKIIRACSWSFSLFSITFISICTGLVICSIINLPILGYELISVKQIILIGVIILIERLISFMMLLINLNEKIVVHKVIAGNVLLIVAFTICTWSVFSPPNIFLISYLFALVSYALPYVLWQLFRKL